MQVSGPPRRLTADIEANLLSIAQEAINNAIKHGKARKVILALEPHRGNIRLGITDDGVGFPSELKDNGGMGLQIMKYRANMIGASLEIQRTNGSGTSVVCLFKKGL